MYTDSVINSVSNAIVKALEKDLSDVELPGYEMHSVGKTVPTRLARPHEAQCKVYVFRQTWGSTALGHGGLGGAAMTDAYTTVIIGPNGDACVYFATRLAYHIDNPNLTFYAHLDKRTMNPTSHAGLYEIDNDAV